MMSFSEEPLTLSNAQLSALLPLLPALAKHSSLSTAETPATTSSSNEFESAREHYTNAEMLEKKKKNERSTRAQTYLLVSGNYIIRMLWFVLPQNMYATKPHSRANKETNFCGSELVIITCFRPW